MSVDKLIADIHKNDLNFAMKVATSTVKALIMEFNYKYGLVVLNESDNKYSNNKKSFVIGYPSGIPVGEVYMNTNADTSGNVYEAYCFFTIHYAKERGINSDDKHTFRSKKISSLLSVLKSKDVIPREEDIIKNNFYVMFARTEEHVTSRIKHETKQRVLDTSDTHALLKLAMGETPMSEVLPEKLNTFRLALEHYNKSDETFALRKAEYDRFYGGSTGFHAVCALGSSYFLVGKFKVTGKTQNYRDMFEQIEPVRFIKGFDNEPELQPLMIMLKMAINEGDLKNKLHNISLVNGTLPLTEYYDESLDMVFYYYRPSNYNGAWMLTPCQ